MRTLTSPAGTGSDPPSQEQDEQDDQDDENDRADTYVHDVSSCSSECRSVDLPPANRPSHCPQSARPNQSAHPRPALTRSEMKEGPMTLIGARSSLGSLESSSLARSSARSSCQCCDRDSGRDGHPATCTGWLDVARRAHAYIAQAGPDAGGLRGNRQAPPRGLCAPGRSAVRCRVQPLPGRSVQSRQVVAGLRRGGNGASTSTPRAAKLVGAPGPSVIARLSASGGPGAQPAHRGTGQRLRPGALPWAAPAPEAAHPVGERGAVRERGHQVQRPLLGLVRRQGSRANAPAPQGTPYGIAP